MMLYKRIIVVCVGVMVLFSIGSSFLSITRAKPVMADFTVLPTIVIDPGHGGVDGGAVGNGVVEKDVNLAICLTMRDIFVASGFDVVMTRDEDISIHDEGIKGTRKQKISDLHNRLAIANSNPDIIFISIHQNKYTSSKSWGTQIFYGPKNPLSESLAAIMQDDFITMLQPENKRKYKKSGKNLYLMYEAECPAVLVECGFVSNQAEAALLSDSEYQSKIAFTTFCSVMRFLGLDENNLE